MSDLLIKGMEMPKAQFQKSSTLYHVEGTIFVYPDGKARAELSVDYKEGKSYPIVSVPSHGRLIDADVMKTKMVCSGYWAKVLIEWINEQKTVIPAEESE